MQRRWIRLLAALFALTLLAAACGGDDDDGGNGGGNGGESPAEDGGGGADLTIVDFSFSPQDLSVTEGQTITISNIGETSHTFTTEDDAIDEEIGPGETVEVTMTGVSSGGFVCRFHSQMTGTLTVG
ncbi:MAG TPA: cupredoxin domain-containing protein [Actinomycetota bacterium]|nr:cupredoxin domain-containing protein [Actinomycetota bacterium]